MLCIDDLHAPVGSPFADLFELAIYRPFTSHPYFSSQACTPFYSFLVLSVRFSLRYCVILNVYAHGIVLHNIIFMACEADGNVRTTKIENYLRL